MLEIDGSRYSGSGAIVRQAVAFAALTGQAVHIVNARARRPKPGLRPQHVRVIEAIRQLVAGTTEGAHQGSREFFFRPGGIRVGPEYTWDIGSAGSTTALTLAVLPVLAFGPSPVKLQLRGGLFQDFAPSFYHLQHVLLPLLRRMGIEVEAEMARPGYVPRGDGVLRLRVKPVQGKLRPLVLERLGAVERVWGIAFSSHLEERRVSDRMAEAAKAALAAAGYEADIEVRNDTSALQAGAALAVFVDLAGGSRLGADRAGAPGRPAEAIGRRVAKELLADLNTGATLDRHAADQIIPFAVLADGESRFRIPDVTDHVQASAWLAGEFFAADVRARDGELVITGVGHSVPPVSAPRRNELEAMLASHGLLFSAQLGIDLASLRSAELFRWFLASLLFGARITETVAVRTYRSFLGHGIATPEAVSAAYFTELLEIMAEGGYVRYDGITSRKVQGASRKLIDEYGGDLNRLHAAASDRDDLIARLVQFKGIGPATAGIFLRELRGLWSKADPPLGELARLAADHLRIADPKTFWRRHAVRGYDFRHFEAALTRMGRDFCRRRRCSQAPLPH